MKYLFILTPNLFGCNCVVSSDPENTTNLPGTTEGLQKYDLRLGERTDVETPARLKGDLSLEFMTTLHLNFGPRGPKPRRPNVGRDTTYGSVQWVLEDRSEEVRWVLPHLNSLLQKFRQSHALSLGPRRPWSSLPKPPTSNRQVQGNRSTRGVTGPDSEVRDVSNSVP